MATVQDVSEEMAMDYLSKLHADLPASFSCVKFISPRQRARAVELCIRLSEVLGLPED